MGAYEKITISLPQEVVAAARTAANAGDGNLSGYVARALRAQVVRDSAEQLAAWRASNGDDLDDVHAMAEEDER